MLDQAPAMTEAEFEEQILKPLSAGLGSALATPILMSGVARIAEELVRDMATCYKHCKKPPKTFSHELAWGQTEDKPALRLRLTLEVLPC